MKRGTHLPIPRALSRGEEEFSFHCRVNGLTPDREYLFHPTRKWRFDFAFPKQKIAVEIEGVTGGMGGRHQRRSGLEGDAYKYNAAVLLGWRVLRYTPAMVTRGDAINDVLEMMSRGNGLRCLEAVGL